jgi:hypothetical protein
MAEVQIRVTLADEAVGGAELELNAPLQSPAPLRLFRALASAGVTPLGDYSVRAGDRLIVHAKLSEQDGSALSRRRAGQVLRAVRHYLDRQAAGANDGSPDDFPSRPDSSYHPPMAA